MLVCWKATRTQHGDRLDWYSMGRLEPRVSWAVRYTFLLLKLSSSRFLPLLDSVDNRPHIQTFKSRRIKTPECSVIQWSKLSEFLYTIYTAEMTNLHTIMKNKERYRRITGKEIPDYNRVHHTTINYVMIPHQSLLQRTKIFSINTCKTSYCC